MFCVKKFMLFDENEFSRAKDLLDSAGITISETVSVPDASLLAETAQRVLFEMGVRTHTKGYAYILAALEHRPIEQGRITKVIYPAVAAQFGTKIANIEKGIRFAIESAWDAGVPERYKRWFQHPEDRPANGVFLRTVADIVDAAEDSTALL